MTLIVFTLFLDVLSCFECNRSDHNKLTKKVDEVDNLVMELEIEAADKVELKVALTELDSNYGIISKFKKDVARFLVTTEKIDKDLADPPALPFCIASDVEFVCRVYASWGSEG